MPLYSTVTAERSSGADFAAAYWADNLRQPVRFAAAVQQALHDGHTVFVEASPHPLLVSAIRETLHSSHPHGLALPTLRRDAAEHATMLGSLAALYAAGCPVAWEQLYSMARTRVRLPTYPWQHTRYWKTTQPPTARNGKIHPAAQLRNGGRPAHPLLGRRVRTAPRIAYFEAQFDQRVQLIRDYRYQTRMVVSAACYVEMGLAAAAELFTTPGQHTVGQVTIHQAIALPEDGTRLV